MEEMYTYEKEQKKHWDKVEGIKMLGMYTPSIPWNRCWLMETDSIDKMFANSTGRTDKIRNTDMVILS